MLPDMIVVVQTHNLVVEVLRLMLTVLFVLLYHCVVQVNLNQFPANVVAWPTEPFLKATRQVRRLLYMCETQLRVDSLRRNTHSCRSSVHVSCASAGGAPCLWRGCEPHRVGGLPQLPQGDPHQPPGTLIFCLALLWTMLPYACYDAIFINHRRHARVDWS